MDHIPVFDLDLASDAVQSPDPYHVNTLRDDRYADQWRFLLSRADGSSVAR